MRTRLVVLALAAGLTMAGAACGDDNGSGSDLRAFCDADAIIESADPFDAANREDATRVAEQMREAFAGGRRAAPRDIAADANRISAVFENMLDDLEAADYDTAKVDPEALFAAAASSDPDFEPALQRVGTYTAEKCSE